MQNAGDTKGRAVRLFREHQEVIEYASVILQTVHPVRKALFAYNLIQTDDLRERLTCVALVAYLSRVMAFTLDAIGVMGILSNPPSKLYLTDEFQEPIDQTASFHEAFGVSVSHVESLCNSCGEQVRLDEALEVLFRSSAPLKTKIGLAFLVGEAFAGRYLELEEIEGSAGVGGWARA